MSELSYNNVEESGIEFYISNDGKQSGMSIRGLARCSGVVQSSMQQLLNNVATGSTNIKSLKPFAGNVFINMDVTDTANNAKIVCSKICAKVIQYYAYESKNAANETAKETLNKFAMIGIENWIKEVTGFTDTTNDKLDQILSILIPQSRKIEKMELELLQMQPIVEEYKVVKDGIHASFRGVETLIEHLTNEDEAPQLKSGNLYTLSQWLQTKRVSMDYANLRKFGRTVSETFKTCTVSVPGKKNVKKPNGKWSCNCTAYSEEHFPILEMALNQFMQN